MRRMSPRSTLTVSVARMTATSSIAPSAMSFCASRVCGSVTTRPIPAVDSIPQRTGSSQAPATVTVVPLRRLSFAASASTSAARPSANPGEGTEPVSIAVTKWSISAR